MLVILAVCLLSSYTCYAQSHLQFPGLKQSDTSKQKADEIRSTFSAAFDDYLNFGFPADEVRPFSKTGRNTRNGWSATLVDALDTLFVMDLQNQFKQGVEKTLKIDFSKSQTESDVSIFESTIRYIGGILAAYELSGATNTALLDQAQKLGDKLLFAWQDEKQILPFPFLNFTTNQPNQRDYISAAAAGSLIFELDRLSFYTHQPKYRQLATKSIQAVMNTSSSIPGMPGVLYGVKNQTILSNVVTWASGVDSYLEYLLKYGMLINNNDTSYYNTWKLAVKSSSEKLIQVSPVRNLTYLSDFSTDSNRVDYESSHLGCFAGGNWLLGGKVLKDAEIFDLGLKLITTCMETYKRTATGLGPEIFRFLGPNNESNDQKPSSQDVKFFQQNGFYIADASYHLRPEVVESAFYAWRLTGDSQYQEFVWQAFSSLKKYCKGAVGYSDISNVNSISVEPLDISESFLFAETFKYMYLTFSDPQLLSLDQYIFSTEAHPFRFQSAQNSNSLASSKSKGGSKAGSASEERPRVIIFLPILFFTLLTILIF